MRNLTSTKFWLTVILTICATVFVILNKLDSQEWIQFILILTGIYSTANVLDKQVTK